MIGEITQKKEVVLGDEKYVAYLKEVATKIEVGGKPKSTMIKAFIKKL